MPVMETRTEFLFVAGLVAAFAFTSNSQGQPLVNIETVTVGGPGNVLYTNGYVAVTNIFGIGKVLEAQPVLYSHGEPTSFEQYMLELINAARANPGAEAARLGIELNQGLDPGTIADTPKPPLAFNPLLIRAARRHSDWMLATGIFDHTGAGNSSPTDRALNEGYTFHVAENIGCVFSAITSA